jgi:ribosomal protein S27AE
MCDNCGAKSFFAEHYPEFPELCNRRLLKHCGKCHSKNYCSKLCQKEHWSSTHRQECEALKSAWITTKRSNGALKSERVYMATQVSMDELTKNFASAETMKAYLPTLILQSRNFELAAKIMDSFPGEASLALAIACNYTAPYTDNEDWFGNDVIVSKCIGKAGVISRLLRAVTLNPLDRNLLVHVCNCVLSLNCTYRHNIVATIAADGLGVIVDAMSRNIVDAGVIQCTLPILTQMICETDCMLVLAAEASAIVVIVGALRLVAKSEVTVKCARRWTKSRFIINVLSALRFVTNFGQFKANACKVLELGTMEVVLDLMVHPGLNERAHREMCAILGELLWFGVRRFLFAGGIQKTVDIARRYGKSAEVQKYAFEIFTNLANHSMQLQISLGKRDTGLVKIIVAAMREHRDSLAVQIQSLNALTKLIHKGVEAQSVAREEGAEFMVTVARRKYGDIDTDGNFKALCDEILESLR